MSSAAIDVVGIKATSVSGSVLTASAMDGHNAVAAPNAVVPAPFQAKASGGKLVVKLPAKAIVVVAVNG